MCHGSEVRNLKERVMSDERRQSNRQRCLFSGQVVMNEANSTISCMVKDLSEGGARVSFGGTTLLPRHFDLMVERKGLRRPVSVVWRHQDVAGLRFG
jgi:hypothetical protein